MNAWKLLELPLEFIDLLMTVIGTMIGLVVTWFVKFAKWIFTIGAGMLVGEMVKDLYEQSMAGPYEESITAEYHDEYVPRLESISTELGSVNSAILQLNATLQAVLDSAAHDDPAHPF